MTNQALISVSGSNSLDHGALLLEAKPPNWIGGWKLSCEAIVAKIQEGDTPFVSIGALAYKIIIFYSRDNHKSGTVWSSPQEVFAFLRNEFQSAASETLKPELEEFMGAFDPLIEAFCIEQPASQIVWSSDDTNALLPKHFGMHVGHSPILKIEVPYGENALTDDTEWGVYVDSSVNRTTLQNAQFSKEAIDVLCYDSRPSQANEMAQEPINFL